MQVPQPGDPMHACGASLCEATALAVGCGMSKENYIKAASVLFDAYTNNYSQEVMVEAMLGILDDTTKAQVKDLLDREK